MASRAVLGPLRQRAIGYSSGSLPPAYAQPQRRPLAWRAASFAVRFCVFSALGAGAVLVGYAVWFQQLHGEARARLRALETGDIDSFTDAVLATNGSTTPAHAAKTAEIIRHIVEHPLVRDELEAPGSPLRPEHPHHRLLPFLRHSNLTAGTLIGPGLMAVPPFVWRDADGRDLVMILHTDEGLCGHPRIVHGGFVATILDEALGRCCMRALPGGVGFTAYLNINYRAPTPADAYVVLRAHTVRVAGRKAWVAARLETLPPPASTDPPVVLAEAEAMFVSPRPGSPIHAFGALARIFGGI